MLSYNDLKSGVIFLLAGQPWQVLESNFLRMQQRKPVNQTKIKNLITGKTVSRNFQPSDNFEEAEISLQEIIFLFNHRDKYVFCQKDNRGQRFEIGQELLGESTKFLKADTPLQAVNFKGKIINVKLPVKMDFKVIEAPPGLKGDTAQGGTKIVTIETGASVSVPLFVNAGDIVRLNTQTGEYTERIKKN